MIRSCTLILWSLVWVLINPATGAAQGSFPFLGEVLEDGVNVRAGGNQNFERLTQVGKGEEIIVVDHQFSWYKIQLPKSAAVYITDKYLTKLNNKQATVNSDKVNLRAGPSINFSVVGQASSGAVVDILDYKDGWYKIEPPETTYGWIQENFLRYKTDLPPRTNVVQAPSAPVAKPAGTAPAAPQVPAAGRSVKMEGELVAEKDAAGRLTYKLVDPPHPPVVIQGLANSLHPFVGFRVQAEGRLQDATAENAPSVLNVSKIQLIL